MMKTPERNREKVAGSTIHEPVDTGAAEAADTAATKLTTKVKFSSFVVTLLNCSH
jgi:hypothetical protein